MRNRHDVPPAEFRNARWCAVYGAMIAAQVRDYVNREGRPVSAKLMRVYHDEACAVADMAEEASNA